MELGKTIAYHRKNKNITQDALAKLLGISNQAVSKWETEQSYPDVELLPKIADIFGITLDELFGRSCVKQEQVQNPTVALPWEDDETLRAVLFVGQKFIQKENLQGKYGGICKEITLDYEGITRNIESYFNVNCGDVEGNITVGGYVECGNIEGSVTVGGYVECGNIEGSVTVGGYVECGEVGGDVTAGSYVECGEVGGNVAAGGYIECGDIGGDVSAGENVNCGDIEGDVTANCVAECGNIRGDVYKNDMDSNIFCKMKLK